MLGSERVSRQQRLVDADRALDLAAAAVERAQGKMRLEGVGVGIHELEEHVERPIGLLGDEIIESGEVVGMELAERHRPAPSPAEVSGENADDQRPDDERPVQQR